MRFVCYSDALLSKLTPKEPLGFDASQLIGFTTVHLEALVKLSSLLDEKQSVVQPPKPPTPDVSSKKEDLTNLKLKQSVLEETNALMRKLDEDIARVLEMELQQLAEVDHNADKRKAPLVTAETFDDSSVSTSSPQVLSPRDDILSDIREGQDLGGTPDIGTSKLDSIIPVLSSSSDSSQDSRPSSASDKVKSERKLGVEFQRIHPSSSSLDLVVPDELLTIKTAYIQVTALKSLHTILLNNKFIEMLLVPKSDLLSERNKALVDGTVIRRDEDFKVTLRSFMKRMVQLALSQSGLLRVFSVLELERAHTILYKILTTSKAEEVTCLSEVKGEESVTWRQS